MKYYGHIVSVGPWNTSTRARARTPYTDKCLTPCTNRGAGGLISEPGAVVDGRPQDMRHTPVEEDSANVRSYTGYTDIHAREGWENGPDNTIEDERTKVLLALLRTAR